MKKIYILVFLFFISIGVFLILFASSYYYKNIENENYSVYKSDDIHVPSTIGIQTIPNENQKVKRMLADTQINTWTANDQTNPKVSFLSDGNFVVVWQSYLERGNGWSIYGQIFYSNGAKKGNEFSISNYTIFNQTIPNVAASSSSKFMVA